jgi:hypothetical protein
MPDKPKFIPLTNPNLCPVDGQSLDWHMKILERHGGGTIFFGDKVGCGFISPMDREGHNYKSKE